MYLRTTQRRNRDGAVVRYVQLAHNRRVEGVTQAEVLVNLGREDHLEQAGPSLRCDRLPYGGAASFAALGVCVDSRIEEIRSMHEQWTRPGD